MSKRAEEAALKAYPDIPLPHLGKNVIAHCGNLRLAYKEGYEQTEKDTIERAARWIMKSENQAKARFRITDDEFIELFRKEMEEE